MVKVGDVIELGTRKLGEAVQRGTVLDVRGTMLNVRWSSGRESVLVPAPGTVTVVSSRSRTPVKKTAAKKTAAKKTAAKKTAAKKNAVARKRGSRT